MHSVNRHQGFFLVQRQISLFSPTNGKQKNRPFFSIKRGRGLFRFNQRAVKNRKIWNGNVEQDASIFLSRELIQTLKIYILIVIHHSFGNWRFEMPWIAIQKSTLIIKRTIMDQLTQGQEVKFHEIKIQNKLFKFSKLHLWLIFSPNY